LAKTEMRVETLDYGPDVLLHKRGLRDQMVKVLSGLDVVIDASPGIDDDFWGLLRSEMGRAGLNCDDMPKPAGARPANATGSVIIFKEANLQKVLDRVQSAVDHWVARGHSRERVIELEFFVAKAKGMERAEFRGPAHSISDALQVGSGGFSDLGVPRSG